ncbi:hypothetical protein DXG01_005448 [Tephrocybe rancida]|nr:hypothetical protein DXG01_005448 [Tephrocybe rancida]
MVPPHIRVRNPKSIVQFYVIVNPASGPGATNSQPDVNYQACIALLRTTGAASGNNVKILGYVATGFGNRASSAVTTDIDTYSNWASAYRPEGIFFDEVATSARFLTNYQTFATRVHTDFGSSFVVLNPGAAPATTAYYTIADLIVSFEGFYDDFTTSNLSISASAPAHKQAVILHDGPTPIPYTTVDTIAEIVGVGASFITDFPNAGAYENFPSDWFSFLGDLIAAQTA